MMEKVLRINSDKKKCVSCVNVLLQCKKAVYLKVIVAVTVIVMHQVKQN